jgi:CHAT domain
MEPVIILAFANHKDEHLALLNRESSNIYRTLQPYDDQRCIILRRLPNASLADISRGLSDYPDQLAIFHYGGHAGAHHLVLETPDGHAMDAGAKGLAGMMGLQKNLQLVFLNGCATKGQVDALLQAGVKAVIATSVPVNDQMACEFAEQFYHFLASGNSIANAFSFARYFLDAKYEEREPERQIIIQNAAQSGTHLEQDENSPNEGFPWGLYLADNKGIETWKLPHKKRTKPAAYPVFAAPDAADAEVNKKLFDTLMEKVAPYSIDLRHFLERRNKGEKIRPNVFRKAIFEAFPVPIGEPLRLLIDENRLNRERLNLLLCAYNSTVQLILFTLLSQLWDMKVEKKDFSIDTRHMVIFNSFFALNLDNDGSYNYMALLETITTIFRENSVSFFMEPLSFLEKSFAAQDDFYRAYLFMELVKRQLSNETGAAGQWENDYAGLCLQTEQHLTVILAHTAFLAGYTLKTIKGIDVLKVRHRHAMFRHHEVVLDRAGVSLEDDRSEYEAFSEHNSVILQKNDTDINDYLNLSPFVIDENALNGHPLSRIFAYCCRGAEEKSFYFTLMIDVAEEKLNIPGSAKSNCAKENYQGIKEQLEDFKRCVLG